MSFCGECCGREYVGRPLIRSGYLQKMESQALARSRMSSSSHSFVSAKVLDAAGT